MFEINIHPIERGLRILAGLVGLALVFWGPKSLLGLFGLIPLVTGIIGWCPPYSWLGINTNTLGRKAS
jgi:hypothetical protein